jgi:hypothetical protein
MLWEVKSPAEIPEQCEASISRPIVGIEEKAGEKAFECYAIGEQALEIKTPPMRAGPEPEAQ